MTTDTNHDTRAAQAFHAATKYVSFQDPAGQTQYGMGTPPNLEPEICEGGLVTRSAHVQALHEPAADRAAN